MSRKLILDPKTGRILSTRQALILAGLHKEPLAQELPPPPTQPEVDLKEDVIVTTAAAAPTPKVSHDLFDRGPLQVIKDELTQLSVEIQATNPNRAEIKFATKDRWRRIIDIEINRLAAMLTEGLKVAS